MVLSRSLAAGRRERWGAGQQRHSPGKGEHGKCPGAGQEAVSKTALGGGKNAGVGAAPTSRAASAEFADLSGIPLMCDVLR